MANPTINTRNRSGAKSRVSTADYTTVARLTPAKKSAAYAVHWDIIGVRVATAASATQPAAYFYKRYALFTTDSSGTVSQVGATQTIGTDLETDSNAGVLIVNDGTNVDVKVSAAYATNWSVVPNVVTMDQILVG